ncbi:hypothetical protein N0V90_001216 [Kalmusia sp. IMI 367209]|nr:hypothetical protein N0V90_001216 [Kalmusia sp. IMI 367209]
MRRQYATGYEERTKATLKTSSRLTWATTTAAAAAVAAYYYISVSDAPASPPSLSPKHTKASDLEAPKPVEDRHGDSVLKHSMAAHKNEEKVRVGKFSGKEFDNHLQKHSTDPAKDFEEKGR